MRTAAFLALALGCIALPALAQDSGATDDETRIRNAAERMERSVMPAEGGISQAEKNAIDTMKSADTATKAVEALSNAANASSPTPSEPPASRETLQERPAGNEMPREPQSASTDGSKTGASTDGEKRPDDTAADEKKKASETASGDKKDTAGSGDTAKDSSKDASKDAAKDSAKDAGKDTATADDKSDEGKEGGAASVSLTPLGGPGIITVPHGRVAASYDPKIKVPGEHTVEMPAEIAAGFATIKGKSAALGTPQPVGKTPSFAIAGPSPAAATFAAVPTRTAAIADIPRAAGGFEQVRPRGVDRARPPAPKPDAAGSPMLETP